MAVMCFFSMPSISVPPIDEIAKEPPIKVTIRPSLCNNQYDIANRVVSLDATILAGHVDAAHAGDKSSGEGGASRRAGGLFRCCTLPTLQSCTRQSCRQTKSLTNTGIWLILKVEGKGRFST